VAIKLIRPTLLNDPEFRQRFQREAQVIASIEHPNVARFFDLVLGDPVFLVMEYVRGPTLTEILKREKQLEIGRAVDLAIRLCWGLHAVHAAGVVHRDLKPSNIIVAADAERGEMPKVIDFGLAKIAGRTVDGAQLTRAGQLIGTPLYMSPEQISGGAVDARADVYSLGCVLFEMLTGQPPFDRSDDLQVLYQQMHQAPPSLTRIRPEVPPALAEVLARALAKSASDRFGSMQEMAHSLTRAVEKRIVAKPSLGRRLLRAALPVAVGAAAGAIVVSAAWRPRVVAPTASGAALVLSSTPADAQVFVDGKPWPETTPTAVRGLTAGSHAVRVAKQGRSIERTVRIEANQRLALDWALPPPVRTLELQTVPAGVTVFIDGRLENGTTPLSITVSDDDVHTIRLEKEGYETLSAPLEPDEISTSKRFELQPEQAPRATLSIDSSLAAEVWLDGGDTGFSTPSLAMRVPAGAHLVELRDAVGRLLATERIELRRGETRRLTLSPAVEQGRP
jgi:serine/threonine-protein kinase